MRVPLVMAALVLASCAGPDEAQTTIGPPPMPDDFDAGDSVSFLVLGDQGRQDATQRATAQAMTAVCEAQGCDFAIALGDNIYDHGPSSLDDPQFDTAFEEPYAALDIPFFLTLGNHDDGGKGDDLWRGDYEVAYTYRDDTSGNWRMPSRYYNQTFGPALEIWSIDGDTLTGDPGGARLGPPELYDGERQQAWLRASVAASDATWKVAFGHYEYSSNGPYGDGEPAYKAALEDTVCDRVQFYFHGHEHDLRWLAPQQTCGRTEFVVSGAAGLAERREDRPQGHAQYFDYRATPGFFWMHIDGETLTAVAYGTDHAVHGSEPVELYRRIVTLAELGW